jgi:hypothetical protein
MTILEGGLLVAVPVLAFGVGGGSEPPGVVGLAAVGLGDPV